MGYETEKILRVCMKENSTVNPVTGCINYLGYTSKGSRSPYPEIRYMGRRAGAHRVAWMLEHGEIGAALHVLHRCDNPRCINVEHLFLGTHKENMADKVAKRRHLPSVWAMHKALRIKGWADHLRGEKHPKAKLTEDKVKAIWALKDKRSGLKVAADFEVSKSLVYGIWSGRVWAWATRELRLP